MLSFTQVELLDLFFRFAAVGSLIFIAFVWLEKNTSEHIWVTRSLLICLSGYLVLTAPINDQTYGFVRGLALLLTELLPYCLWLYVFVLLNPKTSLSNLPWLVKVAALSMLMWFIYFFAIMQGRGSFHTINHLFGIVIYCHIAFMAVYDFQDDLLAQRRKMRVLMAVFFGAYSVLLALLEIFDLSLRGSTLFSVINSSTIFMLIFLFSKLAQITQNSANPQPTIDHEQQSNAVPATFSAELAKVNELMEAQFFAQSNLTIGVLAKTIDIPEHRLRVLINKHLGFQNFSGFLNSYRIPAAQAKLQEAEFFKIPVLTIALELGYGSIGPFNRAFKQMVGVTPTEYRKNFQIRA
ncbi:helix-turn-helix domain-containing protein [Paraglaciecola aestuariivivens]